MTRCILAIFIVILAFTACRKDNRPEVPACIEDQIEIFKDSDLTCSEGAKVDRYAFQGGAVYVFDPGICIADNISAVYNDTCKYLGFLGGIAGMHEINGESFFNAVLEKTVWEN